MTNIAQTTNKQKKTVEKVQIIVYGQIDEICKTNSHETVKTINPFRIGAKSVSIY